MQIKVGQGEQGLADLGNSGPSRMILPHADGLVQFSKVPLPWVPHSVEQIVAPDTVQLVRGSMSLAYKDFTERVKRK